MDMSPPKKKMEKPIFKNFVVATSCALGDQYTDEAITRWVELRRGKFSKEMNDEVTHLVIPRVPTLQDRENPRGILQDATWLYDEYMLIRYTPT